MRKIDKNKFHIYVSIYQRKCMADYMIETRKREIEKLKARIKVN